jgi:hypothetical protein
MESLKQNSKKFTLLENLTEDELNQLNEVVDEQDLKDLLEHNINQENIYRILCLYDFYQYKDITFIEHVQFMILDGKLIIEYDKLNKEDLYNSIFCNDCIKSCKISCDLEEKIHDVICVKYLIKNNHKVLNGWSINRAAENGSSRWTSFSEPQLETIKYLHELGYRGNEDAINYATRNGHLETIKYLHELGYKGSECAINWAFQYNNLGWTSVSEPQQTEIIKYLLQNNYNFTYNAMVCSIITDEIKQLLENNKHLMK